MEVTKINYRQTGRSDRKGVLWRGAPTSSFVSVQRMVAGSCWGWLASCRGFVCGPVGFTPLPVATVRLSSGGPAAIGIAPKTLASIPAKFETILNIAPKENRAFLSQDARFKAGVTAENPGPGRYVLPSTIKVIGEFNKKGLGGFCSKDPRFRHDYETIAKPGPAAYDALRPMTVAVRERTPSRLGSAPLLSSSRSGSSRAPPAPGPGSYEHSVVHQLYTPLHSPAFCPGDRWKENALVLSTPAPGDYSLNRDLDPGVNPGVALRSSTARLPGAPNASVPGPGLYNVESPRPLYSTYSPGMAPAKGTVVPRPASVGPGAYGNPDVPKSPYYGPGVGAFRSKTARIAAPTPAAPGPAYYHPIKVSKKSFHLNNAQTWIG